MVVAVARLRSESVRRAGENYEEVGSNLLQLGVLLLGGLRSHGAPFGLLPSSCFALLSGQQSCDGGKVRY